MARGWESKSVESQIESAAIDTKPLSPADFDPVHIELLRKKESLLLSRTRVCRDLATSHNPRYQAVLHKALKDLNDRLSEVDHEFQVLAAS